MGNLLLLVGCPAAEVREQLLPARLVFGLEDEIETVHGNKIAKLLGQRAISFFFHSFFSLIVFYNQ